MTDGEIDLDNPCPNCESPLHVRCCAWCGDRHEQPRWAMEFCSAKCEREAQHADELSAVVEQNFLKARLNAATRRGLGTMRSYALVATETDTDLSPKACAELHLAIAWLDKQLTRRP